MKMIKISKKNILLILIIMFSFVLTSCKLSDLFEVKTYKTSSVTLSVNENALSYIRSSSIPDYTLEFPNELNVTENTTGKYEVVFYGNDDFEVSSFIAKLIEKYEANSSFSKKLINTQTSQETWMNYNDTKTNEREKYYIKVKNNTIYNEIGYITLENGLQLSMIYARFVDFQNTTYYRWRKEENIRIILHYPLMLYFDEQENANRFVIMAIPNGVIYHLDITSRKIEKVIENDNYLEESFYTFSYVNSYDEDYDNYVNYYINNFNATWIENDGEKMLQYDYLGRTFANIFTKDKFIIKLIK